LASVREAQEDAGGPALAGDRVGVYAGTSTGGVPRWVEYHRARVEGRPPPWGPADTDYGAPARHLARALGSGGPAVTVSTACCSATAAMGLALDDLRRGAVDLAVVGGADAVDRFIHAGFDMLGALTAAEMNPFGQDRSGLVLGEGAGALILETREHARARGVTSRAWLAGAGLGGDANHMTGPDREGRGVERALRMALDDAGVTADDVELICAHATSTPFNDAMEARALHRLFGHRRPAVPAVAYKPVFGHTLGACGLLEAIACVLVLERGTIPPTPGPGPQDPDCPYPLLRDVALDGPVSVAASTNSAFAGNNAAVVLRRAEAP
ncbi:MAG: beta-ketoacyl-[acyl-carrier-protein] synthase family protein, partial [Myxococcota bacterium]|nr:beta-ketoacyl-[acyl-carrier-protein] synthase family protein [Myxococcota bacterium]